MSIKLSVAEYCEDCPNFEVIQYNHNIRANGATVITEHSLHCTHEKQCHKIKKYLESKEKQNENI